MSLNSIIHYDYKTAERTSYTTEEGGAVGEPVFAPKSKNSPDGEGWLIATEYNAKENRSNLIILDAKNVSDGLDSENTFSIIRPAQGLRGCTSRWRCCSRD